MLIDIDRQGWENLLNIVNYLCAGRMVSLSMVENGTSTSIAKADYFHGIEPYLNNLSDPMMAVILGKDQVNLGYFLRNPQKVTLEEKDSREIKRIYIQTGEDKRAVINFLKKARPAVKRQAVVYHHTLSKTKKT